MTETPTAFFSKTYDEAFSLVKEARDYFTQMEPLERNQLGGLDRLRLSSETMRLTARLTQIMAWLLAQRAVYEGELSRESALAEQKALAKVAICMDRGEENWSTMPRCLGALLERSHRLYVRVARLDELARRQAA